MDRPGPSPGGIDHLTCQNSIVFRSHAARAVTVALNLDNGLPQHKLYSPAAAAFDQGPHQEPVVNLLILRQIERSGESGQLRLALSKLRGGQLLHGDSLAALPCCRGDPGLPFLLVTKQDERTDP